MTYTRILAFELRGIVTCTCDASDKLLTLNGEVALRSPGPEGLDKPAIFVFSKMVVCFHCGLTEFRIPQDELRLLAQVPRVS